MNPLAQATTQPSWSNPDVVAAWTALIVAASALIAGIVGGVVLIIKTVRNSEAAKDNKERLDRQTVRLNSIESRAAPATLQPPSSNLLLLPLLLLPFFLGCANMSDGQKLYAARGTYVSTLRAVNTLMEQGVITNANDKEAIWQAKEEAHAALDAAEAKFLAGDKLGFAFVWSRLQSALDRLIRIQLSGEKRAGKAVTLWESPKSSRYFSPTWAPPRSSRTSSAA